LWKRAFPCILNIQNLQAAAGRGVRQREQMKILFIGDIVGSPGREIVADRLADIVQSRQIDLVIANAENSAAGFGITPRIAEELFAVGIEVLTGGNHIWDRKEILEYIPQNPRLVRPANFPEGNPGSGLYVGTARNGVPYAVLDLQGRVFMASIDCPFRAADRELARIPAEVHVIFVDVHAETTSEKEAMGWYLDGRVSAVIGTHTHVATADEHILPAGTAFQTDVGMTGPHNGVIGMDKTAILRRFLNGQPARFEVATGDIQMNTVLIDVDETTGRARSIERLRFRTG
jgi:metallophosphoesterase (TIGR00282 family)